MNLLWFYGLFYGALTAGIFFHSYKHLSPAIMRATILFLETFIFIYTFWVLDLSQVKQYAPIPLIALLLVIFILWTSRFAAKKLHAHSSISQGSFILSAGFSNIGSTGGAFICYLLFGLPGLALGYLFLLPYPFLVFTLGFSIAKQYATQRPLGLSDYVQNIFGNLFSIVPLIAISLGLGLNIAGFSPPSQLLPYMDFLIKLDLVIMCLAIGMTIEFSKLIQFWKSLLSMALIKFLLTPLLALGMILVFFGSLDSLSAQIVLIQSAMPPAIYAVITANLYQLDKDLINALWLSNTMVLIPIAGILYFLFT